MKSEEIFNMHYPLKKKTEFIDRYSRLTLQKLSLSNNINIIMQDTMYSRHGNQFETILFL